MAVYDTTAECHSVTMNLWKERELKALMAIERKVCEKDAKERERDMRVFILEGMWLWT